MITFQPTGFRTLEDDFDVELRTVQSFTLILVKQDGFATYVRTVNEKDALVSKYEDGKDLLLLAWTGNYKTDIFLLGQDDSVKHFKKVKK